MLFSRRCGSAAACLQGLGVSNTAGGMDICYECRVLSGSGLWADHSSRGVLPSVVCRMSVTVKPHKEGSWIRIQSKDLRQKKKNPILNSLCVLRSYFFVT